VRRTVPPSAEIQASIDKLMSNGMVDDPQKMLSELARLGARLIIQRAVEEEFDTWLGRAAVGVGGALGVISLGPIALIPSIIAALAMSRSASASRSALGLLAGAGLLSLFVAFVQRNGPVTTCWHTAIGSGCDQHLNPIPWLVVAIVLVLGGVITQARRMR
jgi:hypothetical protein